MSIYEYIYLGVIGLGFLSSIIFIIYKSYVQARINRSFFKERDIIEYKKELEDFIDNHKITSDDSIMEIAKKAGLQLVECDRNDIDHGYDGRISENKIKIVKDLSNRQKNAIIAHEIAHYLRKNKQLSAGCKSKSILPRPKDEQICDYIASLILLPSDDLKKRLIESQYCKMTKNMRVQFICEIADEKNISMSIVLKRVREISRSLK